LPQGVPAVMRVSRWFCSAFMAALSKIEQWEIQNGIPN
jgi:hypothetical protein